MKKLLLSIMLCLVLCTFAVFAEEFEYIEDPFEITADESDAFETATFFGEENADYHEELEKRILYCVKNRISYIPVLDLEIPGSEFNNIRKFYANVLKNNPYYGFYMNAGIGGNSIGGMVNEIHTSDKGYEEEYIEKMWSDIDKATDEILALLDDDMTDFEKVMTVHDYMVLNYEYDPAILDDDEASVVRDVTMMVEKKGVCMGYAYSFKHVMNVLGIECGYVDSDLMNHEWNIVKIDGEWYHIDVTHDDPMLGGQYDMFATVYHTKAFLSSEAMSAAGAYGFALPEGVEANSEKYDDAPWRANQGSIVTLDGITYYVDGNNLVDETGKVIYEGLATKYGRWNGFGNSENVLLLCGLAPYYGKLYFNTENAIYSYDPKSGKTEKFMNASGLCGLYINGDTLYYGKYETQGNMLLKIAKYGEKDISYMRVDEELMQDICAIIVTANLDTMTEKQKTAANLYTEDEDDGVVKINIKDIIRMAQIFASKKK